MFIWWSLRILIRDGSWFECRRNQSKLEFVSFLFGFRFADWRFERLLGLSNFDWTPAIWISSFFHIFAHHSNEIHITAIAVVSSMLRDLFKLQLSQHVRSVLVFGLFQKDIMHKAPPRSLIGFLKVHAPKGGNIRLPYKLRKVYLVWPQTILDVHALILLS